jgi:hypothetical protein
MVCLTFMVLIRIWDLGDGLTVFVEGFLGVVLPFTLPAINKDAECKEYENRNTNPEQKERRYTKG